MDYSLYHGEAGHNSLPTMISSISDKQQTTGEMDAKANTKNGIPICFAYNIGKGLR